MKLNSPKHEESRAGSLAGEQPSLAPVSATERYGWWVHARWHPAQVPVITFALMIALGTVLLALPVSSRTGQPVPLIDAFFTAASATCVTGLTVVDTGTRFSTFGQMVILLCIQVGGLGLMTLTTVFLVATGRRLAIADRIAIQESFHHSPTGKLRVLIAYIVSATLLTELVGAACLAVWWIATGVHGNAGEAVYSAIFHAISAFCNAGFSLYRDNAMQFQGDPVTINILSLLIISGGLGFLVGLDVKEFLQQKFLVRAWSRKVQVRVQAIRPKPRLSLHSKLVLSITGSLLAIGAISYYLLERNGALAGMSFGEAWLNAWFCSVTARTAGFNTIDYAKLGGPALLCTMVMMFIGASPGSTGGGVKTSTFGLLLIYAVYRWRGHQAPHAFRRSIPADTVDRASSVVIAAVAVVILAASLLMALEAHTTDPQESQARFLPLAFETISAFGTVGLSMGLTGSLTAGGKVVVALLMFVGRVGPLTLALGIASRRRRGEYSYAEENVMVG
jgi:trk system potassium uptake protein TrkH